MSLTSRTKEDFGMKKEKHFSISEAARLCGVTAKQIRNWEFKDYIPKAARIECGERTHREFSESDLQLIRKIGSYLKQGFNLAAAARKSLEDKKMKKEDL
jgi:DNA-binding transcriptional MerR regulator